MSDTTKYKVLSPEEVKALNLSKDDINALPVYDPTQKKVEYDAAKGIKIDQADITDISDEEYQRIINTPGAEVKKINVSQDGYVNPEELPHAYTYENQATPYILKTWQESEIIDKDEIMSDDEKSYLRDAKAWMTPEQFEASRKVFRGEDPKQQEDNIFTRAIEGAIEGAGVGLTVSGFTPVSAGIGAGAGAIIGATAKAIKDDKKYYFDEQGIPRALGRGELPPPGSKTASVWGFGNSVEDDNAMTGFAKNATNMIIQTGGSFPQLLNILAGVATGNDINYLKNIESDIDSYQFQLSSKAQKPIFSMGENGTEWDLNMHNSLATIGQAIGSIAAFMGAGRAVGVPKETNAVTQAARSARAIGGANAVAKPLTLAEKAAMNAPWKYPKQWLVGSMINMSEAAQSMREAGLDDRSGYASTLVTALGMGALEMMIGGQELNLITKRKIFKDVADQITKTTTKDGIQRISSESIDQLYKATLKSGIRELAKYGKSVVKTGFGEAAEESIQDVYSKFVQFMHDKFPSMGNKYGTEMLSGKSIESYVNSAIGGFAGAPVGIVTGDVERTKNEEIYRHIKNGTEDRLVKQLDLEAKMGFLDQSEVDDYKNRVSVYKKFREKLAGNEKHLNDDQRRDLFEALWQHQNAAELMNSAKPAAESPTADPIDKAAYSKYEKEVKLWEKKVDDLLNITPAEVIEEAEKASKKNQKGEEELSISSTDKKDSAADKKEVDEDFFGEVFEFTSAPGTKAKQKPSLDDVKKEVLTEENYNAWSNVRDKSDYKAFVDQVESTLEQLNKVEDKTKLTSNAIDSHLSSIKAFRNKAIREKVASMLSSMYELESKNNIDENSKEKSSEVKDVIGEILVDEKDSDQVDSPFTFKNSKGEEITIKEGFAFSADKPIATARKFKSQKGAFIATFEKPTDDEDYSDSEEQKDGSVKSAPRKKGRGYIIRLDEKGNYRDHKEFTANQEEGTLSYGSAAAALRQVGARLKSDLPAEKKLEEEKKRQAANEVSLRAQSREKVRKLFQNIKGFSGESKKITDDSDFRKAFNIDPNSTESDFNQDDIDGTFGQKDRKREVKVWIKDGVLYEESGTRTFVDKKSDKVVTAESSAKAVKLYRVTDKYGNKYLVGSTKVSEGRDGNLYGTAFVLQLDDEGKEVRYSKRFYYNANQKDATNWDGLSSIIDNLEMNALPKTKPATVNNENVKQPFNTKQEIIDTLRRLSAPYKFGEKRDKNEQKFIGFNRLVNGEKKPDEDSKDALSAGLIVDKIVRDFFGEREIKYEQYGPEQITEDAFNALKSGLTRLRMMMNLRGETVIPEGITLADPESGVKSEMDLVTVDEMLQIRVYDVKTMLSYDMKNYRNKIQSNGRTKEKDHRLQLSLYNNLIEQNLGVKVTQLGIIPIVVDYEKGKGVVKMANRKDTIEHQYDNDIQTKFGVKRNPEAVALSMMEDGWLRGLVSTGTGLGEQAPGSSQESNKSDSKEVTQILDTLSGELEEKDKKDEKKEEVIELDKKTVKKLTPEEKRERRREYRIRAFIAFAREFDSIDENIVFTYRGKENVNIIAKVVKGKVSFYNPKTSAYIRRGSQYNKVLEQYKQHVAMILGFKEDITSEINPPDGLMEDINGMTGWVLENDSPLGWVRYWDFLTTPSDRNSLESSYQYAIYESCIAGFPEDQVVRALGKNFVNETNVRKHYVTTRTDAMKMDQVAIDIAERFGKSQSDVYDDMISFMESYHEDPNQFIRENSSIDPEGAESIQQLFQNKFGFSITKDYVAQINETAKAISEELSEVQTSNEQRREPASPSRQAVKEAVRPVSAKEFNEMSDDAKHKVLRGMFASLKSKGRPELLSVSKLIYPSANKTSIIVQLKNGYKIRAYIHAENHVAITPEEAIEVDQISDYVVYKATGMTIVPAYGLRGYDNNIIMQNASGQETASIAESDFKSKSSPKPTKEQKKAKSERIKNMIRSLDRYIEYYDELGSRKLRKGRGSLQMGGLYGIEGLSYKIWARLLKTVRTLLKQGETVDAAVNRAMMWLNVKHKDVKVNYQDEETLRAEVYTALGLEKQYQDQVNAATYEEDEDAVENTSEMSSMMDKEVVRKIFLEKVRHLFVNYDNGKPWIEGYTMRQMLDAAFDLSEKMPANTQNIKQYYIDNFPIKEMSEFWKGVNEIVDEYDQDSFVRLHNIMKSSLRVGYLSYGNFNLNRHSKESVKPFTPILSNPAIDKRQANQYVKDSIIKAEAWVKNKDAIARELVKQVYAKASEKSIAEWSKDEWNEIVKNSVSSVDESANWKDYFNRYEINKIVGTLKDKLSKGEQPRLNLARIFFQERIEAQDAEFANELMRVRANINDQLIASKGKTLGKLKSPAAYFKKMKESAIERNDGSEAQVEKYFREIARRMAISSKVGSSLKQMIESQNEAIASMMGLPLDLVTAYQNNQARKNGFETAEASLAYKIVTTDFSSAQITEVRKFLAGIVTRDDLKRSEYLEYRKLFEVAVGSVRFPQKDALAQNYSGDSARQGFADRFSDVTRKSVDAIEFRSWLTDRLTRDITNESIAAKYADNPWVQRFKGGLKFFNFDGITDTREKESSNRNQANQSDLYLIRLINFFNTEQAEYAGTGNYLTLIEQQADSSKKYMVQAEKKEHNRDAIVNLLMSVPIDNNGNKMTRVQAMNALDADVREFAEMIEYFGAKNMLRTPEFKDQSSFYGNKEAITKAAQNFVYNEVYNKYYIDQFIRGKKLMTADAREIAKRKSSGQGMSMEPGIPGGIRETHKIAIWTDPEKTIQINGKDFQGTKFTDGASLIMPWFDKQIKISSGHMFGGQVKIMTFSHNANDEQIMVKANDTALPELPEDIDDADSIDYMESVEFYNRNPLIREIVEHAKKHQIDRIVFKSAAKIHDKSNVNEIEYSYDQDGNIESFAFPEIVKTQDISNRDMRVMLDLSNDGAPHNGIIPTQIINTLRMIPGVGVQVDELIDKAANIKAEELIDLFKKSPSELIEALKDELREDPENMQLLELSKIKGLSFNDPIFQNQIGRIAKNIVTRKLLNLMAPKGLCVQAQIPGITGTEIIRQDEDGYIVPGRSWLPANMKRSESNPNGLLEGDAFIQIRVPTSGEQQLQVCIVEGFLPGSMKNTIVNDNSVMIISGNDMDGDAVHVWVPYRNIKGSPIQLSKKNQDDYRAVINKIWEIIFDTYTDAEHYNRMTRPMDTKTIKEELLDKQAKETLHTLLPSSGIRLFKSNTESRDIIERTAATLKVASYLNAYNVKLKESITMPRFNYKTMKFEEPVLMTGWNGDAKKKADNMWELGNQTNHATDDPKEGTLSLMSKFLSTCGFQDVITSMDSSLTYSAIMFCKIPIMQKFIRLYDFMNTPYNKMNTREMYDVMYHVITNKPKSMEEILDPLQIQSAIQMTNDYGKKQLRPEYEQWQEPVYEISSHLLNRALEGKALNQSEQLEILAYFRTINYINQDMLNITAAINANTKGVKSVSETNRLENIMKELEDGKTRMIDGLDASNLLNMPSMTRARANRVISNNLFNNFSTRQPLAKHAFNAIKNIAKMAQNTKFLLNQEASDAMEGAFNAWSIVQALNITESKKELRERSIQIFNSLPANSPVRKYLAVNPDGILAIHPSASKDMEDYGFITKAQTELEEGLKAEELWTLTKSMIREFGWTRSHWKGSYYSLLPNSVKRQVAGKLNGLYEMISETMVDKKELNHVVEQMLFTDPDLIPKIGLGTDATNAYLGTTKGHLSLFRDSQIVPFGSNPEYIRVREEGKWIVYKAKRREDGAAINSYEKVEGLGASFDVMPIKSTEEQKEKNDESPLGNPDGPEYMSHQPRKKANPKLIKFVQQRMKKMFPNVRHFETPEAFESYMKKMGVKESLDLSAWGAAFGNAFWINPEKPHQETWIHEHAHIYWNLLPEDHPVKKRLINYYGSVENAIVAVGKAGLDIAETEMNQGLIGRLKNWLKIFWANVRDMLWGSATPVQYARIMADAVWNKGAFETNHNNFREYVLEYMKNDPTQSFTSQEEAIAQIEQKLGKKITEATIDDIAPFFQYNYRFETDSIVETPNGDVHMNDKGETFWFAIADQFGAQLLSNTGKENNDPSDLWIPDLNQLSIEMFGENYDSLKRKSQSDPTGKYKNQVEYLEKKVSPTIDARTTRMYNNVISLVTNEQDLNEMSPELLLENTKMMAEAMDDFRRWGIDPTNSRSASLLYAVHKVLESKLMAHHFLKAIKEEAESDGSTNKVYTKALRELLYPETMKPFASFLDSTFGKDMVRPMKSPMNVQSDIFQLRNQIVARASQKAVRHQAAISAKIKNAFDKAKKAGLNNDDISFIDEDNKRRYYVFPGSAKYVDAAANQDAKSRAIVAFADAYADIIQTYLPASILNEVESNNMYQVAFTDSDLAEHRKKFGLLDTILDKVSSTGIYDQIHPGPKCVDDNGEMIRLGEYKLMMREKLRSGALGNNKALATKKYLNAVSEQEKLAEELYRSNNKTDAKGYVIPRIKATDMLRGVSFKETDRVTDDWSVAADKMISQYAFIKEIEDEMPVLSYMENRLMTGGDQQKNLGLFMKRFNDLHLYGRTPESNLSPKWQRILRILQEYTAFKFMGLNVGAAIWNAGQGFTSNIRDYGFSATMRGYRLILRDYFMSRRNTKDKPTLSKLGEIFMSGKFVKILQKEGIVQIGKDWSTSSSSRIVNRIKKLAFSPTALVEFMNQGVTMYALMTPEQRAAYDDEGNIIDPANALTEDQWIQLIARIQKTHGSYHPMFKRLIGSTPEGGAFISLKTWLADMYWMHFGGDEYNGMIDEHQRGMVTSGQRWMKAKGARILEAIGKMPPEQAQQYYNNLDELDKINLYRLARELGMMLAFAMLMAAGDDDDAGYKASSKMLKDLSFVYNLTNYQNLIKGGLPVGTTIVDSIDLVKNMFGSAVIGGAEYQYRADGLWGKKGDSKLPMYVVNVLPGQSVIKQVARLGDSE